MGHLTLGDLNLLFHEVFLDDSIEVQRSTTSEDIAGWDSFSNLS